MYYLSVCNRDAFKSFYRNALSLLFEKFFRCYEKCFHTAQKMKFSVKDFFNKYDQIHRKLWM